jgi:hypothetical protein
MIEFSDMSSGIRDHFPGQNVIRGSGDSHSRVRYGIHTVHDRHCVFTVDFYHISKRLQTDAQDLASVSSTLFLAISEVFNRAVVSDLTIRAADHQMLRVSHNHFGVIPKL